MNINQLPTSSVKVLSGSLPSDKPSQKLNINTLPKGSYQVLSGNIPGATPAINDTPNPSAPGSSGILTNHGEDALKSLGDFLGIGDLAKYEGAQIAKLISPFARAYLQQNPQEVPTAKQTLGSAINTGALLATAGMGGATAETALGRIAQTGAQGALVGGAGGLGQGVQKENNVQGIVKDTAIGTGIGSVLGAGAQAVGEGVGAVKNLVKGSPENELSTIQDTISPKPTVKEARLAESQGRLVKGNKPTLFKGGTEDTVLPSNKVVRAAQTIQETIPGAAQMDEPTLYKALDTKTGEIAQALKPEMEKTPVTQETMARISNEWTGIKSTQLENADASEEANVTKLQSKFQATLDKLGKTENPTMNDYWEARQAYDDSIPKNVKEANNLSPESLQNKKAIWLQNRGVLNNAINDSSTGLGDTSKQAFSNMTDMYNAKQNILTKAKITTKPLPSKIGQFTKSPTGKFIGSALSGASVFELGKKIVTGEF